MSNYKTDLERMLRNVRTICGFTQHQVADMLKISRSTYSWYELGKTSPDLGTLRKLASLFSIPVEAFLYPEEYADMDVKQIRVKSKKILRLDPQKIGDLTAEEKALITAYRIEK